MKRLGLSQFTTGLALPVVLFVALFLQACGPKVPNKGGAPAAQPLVSGNQTTFHVHDTRNGTSIDIDGAKVLLITCNPQANTCALVDSTHTNSQGIASFTGIPNGSYLAVVIKDQSVCLCNKTLPGTPSDELDLKNLLVQRPIRGMGKSGNGFISTIIIGNQPNQSVLFTATSLDATKPDSFITSVLASQNSPKWNSIMLWPNYNGVQYLIVATDEKLDSDVKIMTSSGSPSPAQVTVLP